MSPIRSAATLPANAGWILALELDDETKEWAADADVPLKKGQYIARLSQVDCEGCAATVEGALQKIHGVSLAGCVPQSSTLVFEVSQDSVIHKSDIEEELAAASQALKKRIALSNLRGPLPALFSAA